MQHDDRTSISSSDPLTCRSPLWLVDQSSTTSINPPVDPLARRVIFCLVCAFNRSISFIIYLINIFNIKLVSQASTDFIIKTWDSIGTIHHILCMKIEKFKFELFFMCFLRLSCIPCFHLFYPLYCFFHFIWLLWSFEF